MSQKTAMAMKTITQPMKTSIIGSISLAKRLMRTLSSSLYILRMLSTDVSRLAVSSQTLMRTATLPGMSSVSYLSASYMVSHFWSQLIMFSIIS